MNIDKEKNINYTLFVIAALLIILDQITKILVKGFNLFGIEHQGIDYGAQIPVIGDFLILTFIENPGMAFGISFGWGKIFLSLFSVVAAFGLALLIDKLKGYDIWIRIGFTLVFAGAFGNLIDRVFYGVFYSEDPLFYGKVVDFIQVDIPDVSFMGLNYTHWPVFNVADSCVTVGVIILLLFNARIPNFPDLFKSKNPDQIDSQTINENSN